MSCLLNEGISAQSCVIIPGGVKEIYIANYTDNITYTKAMDGSITAIGFGTAGASEKFYKFDVPRATTIIGSPLQVAGELRSGFLPFVTFNVYNTLTQSILNLSVLLATGKFIVGVKKYDDTSVILGTGSGLIVSALDFLGGAAVTDATGLTCTLTGLETTPAVAFTGTYHV